MLLVFVASCVESLDLNIERLKENIHPQMSIVIISGGHDKEEEEFIFPFLVIKVKYRCFEFTPFYYILENPDRFCFDYAFFTHDTVTFGPLFYTKVQEIKSNLIGLGYDTYKFQNKSKSMNIGLYSKSVILSNAAVLYDTIDFQLELRSMKEKLVGFEDYILDQNPILSDDAGKEIVYTFYGTYTNTPANGRIFYFDKIDFFKFQSNTNFIQSVDIPKLDDFPNYSTALKFIH